MNKDDLKQAAELVASDWNCTDTDQLDWFQKLNLLSDAIEAYGQRCFEAGRESKWPSADEAVAYAKHLDSDKYFGAMDMYRWLKTYTPKEQE